MYLLSKTGPMSQASKYFERRRLASVWSWVGELRSAVFLLYNEVLQFPPV